MLPLSFKEYVTSTGSETDLSRKYVDYLQNSSFPYALAFAGKQKEIHEYLDGVFNTIVVKDISLRKKIADTMTSAGRKIDTKTVEVPETWITGIFWKMSSISNYCDEDMMSM